MAELGCKLTKDKACAKKSKCKKQHISGTGSTTITIISSTSSECPKSCSKAKKHHSKHQKKHKKSSSCTSLSSLSSPSCSSSSSSSSSSSYCKNSKYYKCNDKFVKDFIKFLQNCDLESITKCLPKDINLLISDQTCIIPYAGEFCGNHRVVEAFIRFASYVSFSRVDVIDSYSNKCANSIVVRLAVDQVNRLKPIPESSCRKLELTFELIFIFDFCDDKINYITIIEETGPLVLFYGQEQKKKAKKTKPHKGNSIIIG